MVYEFACCKISRISWQSSQAPMRNAERLRWQKGEFVPFVCRRSPGVGVWYGQGSSQPHQPQAVVA
ncbi:hypothetical protein HanXRQr2_Chr12g0531821 [Helianthus annuus]|uniref:Uncharacterized protein n=1 Tax=Helianthus annuus TaxID=4232 RepID=A0A9K3MUU0_HELAN|nr:hypothetical protein HanXRQr2_Chr12g0531821 [Helianthus annuus]